MANVSKMESPSAPADAAKLTVDGKAFDLNLRHGTIGPDVIDISSLYGHDQACSPTIRDLRRPRRANRRLPTSTATKGILLYRGYPIEQLAEHGDFLEDPATCCSTANCRRPRRRPTSTTA